jgi:outer membrane immunogenic protein
MKKLLLGSMVALVMGSAMAADLPPRLPVIAEPIITWNGFYVGASLGERRSGVTWTTTGVGVPATPPDSTTTPAIFDMSKVRAGAYFGYNWQFAPTWVAGIEADIAWANSSRTLGGVPGTFGTSGLYAPPSAAGFDSSWVRERWDASVRVRLGFLVTPTWLIYATGGVAIQSIEVGASCSGMGSSWCADGIAHYEPVSYARTGFTGGGGTEVALLRNLFARAEYRYSDFGYIDYTFFTVPATVDNVVTSVRLRTHTVLVGIAFKFE